MMPTKPMGPGGDTGQSAEAMPADQAGMDKDESVSVFIPKAALMGKTYKEGDTIPMEVKDVDPETGDVEAVCSKEMYDQEQKPGYEDAFDKAMPEQKEAM